MEAAELEARLKAKKQAKETVEKTSAWTEAEKQQTYDVIHPCGRRALLLWIIEEKTKGGLHIADTAKEKTLAEVYDLGDGVEGFKRGDIVMVATYAGRTLKVEVPVEKGGMTTYVEREGQIVPVEYIEAVVERRVK